MIVRTRVPCWNARLREAVHYVESLISVADRQTFTRRPDAGLLTESVWQVAPITAESFGRASPVRTRAMIEERFSRVNAVRLEREKGRVPRDLLSRRPDSNWRPADQ